MANPSRSQAHHDRTRYWFAQKSVENIKRAARAVTVQTLSEFLSQWQPAISQQAKTVADKIEEGRDMSRFLSLEPQLRAAVDAAVRDYSASGSIASYNPESLDIFYLLHLRLLEGCCLAQFLSHCGFSEVQMPAKDWIEFLAIDSWHEFTRHKWRNEFERVYPTRNI